MKSAWPRLFRTRSSLLYAVLPERGYFDLSPAGIVTVENDGATRFRPTKDPAGRHRFLMMKPEQAARVREAVVQLSIEPWQGKR